MSDCSKCWETPCCCGWGYRNYDIKRRVELAANVLGLTEELLKDKLQQEIPEHHPLKQIKE